MTTPIRFSRLNAVDGVDGPAFAAAMAIYLASFPAAERHPVETVRARVVAGRSHLYIGVHGEDVVFMALLWPLTGTDFILLDYMATASGQRGRGIAGAFMAHMRRELEADRRWFVMEVEDPARGDNRAERVGRVRMYRHLGARELAGVRYLLPPLQGDAPTDMVLMLFPDYPGKAMTGALVEGLIRKIYLELYGRSDEDPFLQRSLAGLPDRITIT